MCPSFKDVLIGLAASLQWSLQVRRNNSESDGHKRADFETKLLFDYLFKYRGKDNTTAPEMKRLFQNPRLEMAYNVLDRKMCAAMRMCVLMTNETLTYKKWRNEDQEYGLASTIPDKRYAEVYKTIDNAAYAGLLPPAQAHQAANKQDPRSGWGMVPFAKVYVKQELAPQVLKRLGILPKDPTGRKRKQGKQESASRKSMHAEAMRQMHRVQRVQRERGPQPEWRVQQVQRERGPQPEWRVQQAQMHQVQRERGPQPERRAQRAHRAQPEQRSDVRIWWSWFIVFSPFVMVAA
eukprot:jgi/Ulvmu1/11115/UM070_0031.1